MESIENKLFLTEKINQGTRSAIYRVPNTNHVAKVRYDEDQTTLYNEFNIARDLYNFGIKVAKPIRLTKVLVLEDGKKVEKSAFIQEELVGDNLENMYLFDLLDSNSLRHADNLRKKEVKKAVKIGFIPGDSYARGNAIYNKKKKISYLVDFEDWSKKYFTNKKARILNKKIF